MLIELTFLVCKAYEFFMLLQCNVMFLHEQFLTEKFLTNSFCKVNLKKYWSVSFTLASRKCPLLILLKIVTSVCSYWAFLFFLIINQFIALKFWMIFCPDVCRRWRDTFSLETHSLEGIISVSSPPFLEKNPTITFELKYKLPGENLPKRTSLCQGCRNHLRISPLARASQPRQTSRCSPPTL